MQAVLQPSKQFKHLLEWCLTASILAHLVVMFAISKPTFEVKPAPPQEIKIELVKPKLPEPTPVQAETPPPTKSAPVSPQTTPITPKPVAPQKPSPIQETPTEQRPQPVAEPVVQTSPVIAVKPTVSDSKPEMVTAPPAPPPEPVKVSGPSEGDIEAARMAFRNAAHRELKKNQRYPRIAQDRGIEGDVKLSINLDDQGNITAIEVVESSGNKPIDDAAVAAAQKSQLKSHFNEILRGKINNIIVTVSFKLTS